jgi:prepilin-type N-terminal cleavage/methylation domain-containing protein
MWNFNDYRCPQASQTNRPVLPARSRGRGFTLIELIVVMGVIGLLLALLLPSVQSVRETARRLQCQNNLKQLGLAAHAYHDSHSVLPFGVGDDQGAQLGGTGDRRYSALALLLPWLDQRNVYERINFNVAPFDPYPIAGIGQQAVLDSSGDVITNSVAAKSVIPGLLCPSDMDLISFFWGRNNYRSCNGSTWSGRQGNGMFGQISSVRFGDVSDGLSNTALFSERCKGSWNDAVHDPPSDLYDLAGIWTESTFTSACEALSPMTAIAYHQDVESGMTWLEGNMNWTRYNHVLSPNRISCKNGLTWDGVIMSATSRHHGGVNLVLADGSVRFVSENVYPPTWQAIGTIGGNEELGEY